MHRSCQKVLSAVLAITALLIIVAPAAYALTPLTVAGNKVVAPDGKTFVFRAINVNDYMECGYLSLGSLTSVTNWLHREEDFQRIKSMGFNAVRLNVGQCHFEQPEKDRIKALVSWALKYGLYPIVARFAPPGAKEHNGYYEETGFWKSVTGASDSTYRDKFLNEWNKTFDVLSELPSGDAVIYEMLNEPQITIDPNVFRDPLDGTLVTKEVYAALVDEVMTRLRAHGNQLMVVDGMEYAKTDYQAFSFIDHVKVKGWNNIVYTYHLYLSEIAFKGCNWNTPACTEYKNNPIPYSSENPGWQTVQLDPVSPATADAHFSITSWKQSGTYEIASATVGVNGTTLWGDVFGDKYFEKYDYDKQSYTISPDPFTAFCDSQVTPCTGLCTRNCTEGCDCSLPSCNCALLFSISGWQSEDPFKKKSWQILYGNMYGSANKSSILLSGGTARMSNTAGDASSCWAEMMAYSWLPENNWHSLVPHISLTKDTTYRATLVVKGNGIDDNGGLQVNFKTADGSCNIGEVKDGSGACTGNGMKMYIRNLCYGDPKCKEVRLASHPERIQSAIGLMKALSEAHGAPFFLGEFGVPLVEREPKMMDYFQTIVNAAEQPGLSGYGLYVYREMQANNQPEDDSWITFGLFSGWQLPVTQSNLVATFGAGSVYYRPAFINGIKNVNGVFDILWRNASNGRNMVWYTLGTLRTGTAYLPSLANQDWQMVGTGDFNKDGKTDILWRNTSNGRNMVWYMNGLTRTGTAYLASMTNQDWRIVGVADFNNDGKGDILWRNISTGRNLVWYMNGVTRTGTAYLASLANQNWKMVGTGDFNNDGKPDILWRNSYDGRNMVWYMNESVRIGIEYLNSQTDQSWKIVGTGDFNNDGKVDILWRNIVNGRNMAWYMNGANRTGTAYLVSMTNQDWKIVGGGQCSY